MHHMHKPISDYSMLYEQDLYIIVVYVQKKFRRIFKKKSSYVYKHQCTSVVEIACTCIPVDKITIYLVYLCVCVYVCV